jgi:hypothetical protein
VREAERGGMMMNIKKGGDGDVDIIIIAVAVSSFGGKMTSVGLRATNTN